MANYGNMVLTQKGYSLYAKVQSGVPLNFTRMQIGGGQLAVGQEPTALTALITPVSYLPINSITNSGNTAHVKGILENAGISVASYSCELGLFATDPTEGEILYAYANAGTEGDTIPPISAGPFSKQFQVNTAIGNSTTVTATIPAGAYIPTIDKGVANGVASLDSSGTIPDTQIPAAIARDAELTSHANRTDNPHNVSTTQIGAETPTGAQTKVNTHGALTSAHGSTSAATASAIMQRDASGRAKVAAPSASDDIARKDTVDAVQTNLSAHTAATNNPHNVTAAQIGAIDLSSFVNSKAASGYQKLPGGLIIQWGTTTSAGSSGLQVTFPIAFPTNCASITANAVGTSSVVGYVTVGSTTLTDTFFYRTGSTGAVSWKAIGY